MIPKKHITSLSTVVPEDADILGRLLVKAHEIGDRVEAERRVVEEEELGDEDGGAKDFADMTQAEAIEAARRCADPETLQGWLLMTRNNQVKGAIKARLAELA